MEGRPDLQSSDHSVVFAEIGESKAAIRTREQIGYCTRTGARKRSEFDVVFFRPTPVDSEVFVGFISQDRTRFSGAAAIWELMDDDQRLLVEHLPKVFGEQLQMAIPKKLPPNVKRFLTDPEDDD